MPELSLPASVKSRACYSQLLGAWAIEQQFLDSGLAQVQAIGMEAIWARNEKLGEYPEFSPAVFTLAEQIQGLDPKAVLAYAQSKAKAQDGESQADNSGPPPYVNYKGTAVIPVSGPLSKMPTSLGHMFGGSSTVGMRKALALALADPQVQRVMLHIDSPGGTVYGTGDLGDDLFAARSVKPTAAFIEDLGASAAYWLGSQMEDLYASPHASVGSIGVYSVVYDSSQQYKDAGIKVHVIKTGAFKGAGVPGAPITDAALAKMQKTVDAMHNSFVATVARGRGMTPEAVGALADGSLYMAPEALRLGLVDAIGSFRAALEDFGARMPPQNSATGEAKAPVLQRRKRNMTAPGYSATDAKLILITTSPASPTGSADLSVVIGAASYTGQAIPSNALVTVMSEDGFEEGRMMDEIEKTTSKSDDVAATDEEDGGLNTGPVIVGVGDSPMADPPNNPAGSGAAAPPLTAAALEALQRDAELGRKAHAKLEIFEQAKNDEAKAFLSAERERIMADYGTPKEAVLACQDLGSLRALESVERRHASGRTRAGASKAQPDAKIAPNLPNVTAELQKHLAKTFGIHDGAAAYTPPPTTGGA